MMFESAKEPICVVPSPALYSLHLSVGLPTNSVEKTVILSSIGSFALVFLIYSVLCMVYRLLKAPLG